jgi:hypothetical protein
MVHEEDGDVESDLLQESKDSVKGKGKERGKNGP